MKDMQEDFVQLLIEKSSCILTGQNQDSSLHGIRTVLEYDGNSATMQIVFFYLPPAVFVTTQ
jgi:hypothetical protein